MDFSFSAIPLQSNQRQSSCDSTQAIIAIGASTGGTEAILDILRLLPSDMPGIMIVQHMPEKFTHMFAERLNSLCQLEVREAKPGDILHPGLALIAPGGDQHARIVQLGGQHHVHFTREDKVNGHCPSVDVLFHSVAKSVGKHSVGVILTGMGNDGAKGLLAMRRAGAYTLGQDSDSCVVSGMPIVAHQIGAVEKQASPQEIAVHLKNYFKKI